MEKIKTIALFGAGDMGSGVGRTLVDAGFRVVSDLTPRSAASQANAVRAGVEDAGSFGAALEEADLVLSVMPPGHAEEFAKSTASELRRILKKPLFADLNAISPATMTRIAQTMSGVEVEILDGGIIGPSPDKGCPRVYLSGEKAKTVSEALNRPDMKVIALGPDVGQASALKMMYAGLNKGMWAMMATMGVAADKLGLLDAFLNELEQNNRSLYDPMQRWVGFLAADAHRFGPEMDEIAGTLSSLEITSKFHEGARWAYDLLNETPLREETRATADRNRSLATSIQIFRNTLDKRS